MRNLIIILLVSVLGCIWVLQPTKNDTIDVINHQIEVTNLPLENMIRYLFINLSEGVSAYPQFSEFLNTAIKIESFMDSIAYDFVPTNPVKAKEFTAQQTINYKRYFSFLEKLSDYYSYDIKNDFISNRFYFTFNENFFHHNSKYQYLLRNIHCKLLQFNRLDVIKHLSKITKSDHYFCYNQISILAQNPISTRKASTFPFIYIDTCYPRKRSNTRKIWVNDVLIYDVMKGDEFPYDKIALVYNGKKNHKVKVEFLKHIFSPASFAEEVYNFQLATCENNSITN